MNRKKIYIMCISMMTFGVMAQQGAGSGVSDDDLQLNTITTAVPFASITPDSRAGGMGDAGTALSGSSTSVYWNTSMLTFAEEKSEISLSYTPWLRQLTNDIHLSYLAGYYQLNDRHTVGGALRYFNLGEITFTDNTGGYIRDDKPSEFELTGGYAFRLSDKLSVGMNGKFIYSNLTGGLIVSGVETRPGIAGAADVSFTYFNEDAKIGSVKGAYSFATTINNVGNKIAYSSSDGDARDFLPMNIKIGNSFRADFDKYNKVTFSVDVQRLLVPTPQKVEVIDGEAYFYGRNANVGVISGMLQSFSDAPGQLAKDESGNFIETAESTTNNRVYELQKGSRFKEEMTEFNLAAGVEYWYNDVFALRGGMFYEHPTKGNRQFINLGAGFKYNAFGIDISYLAALKRNNPLANTLRFTLRMALGAKSSSSANTAP